MWHSFSYCCLRKNCFAVEALVDRQPFRLLIVIWDLLSLGFALLYLAFLEKGLPVHVRARHKMKSQINGNYRKILML